MPPPSLSMTTIVADRSWSRAATRALRSCTKRHVPDDQQHRADVGGGRAERRGDDAVDAVDPPVREAPDPRVAARQECVQVADGHRAADVEQGAVRQEPSSSANTPPSNGSSMASDRLADRRFGDRTAPPSRTLPTMVQLRCPARRGAPPVRPRMPPGRRRSWSPGSASAGSSRRRRRPAARPAASSRNASVAADVGVRAKTHDEPGLVRRSERSATGAGCPGAPPPGTDRGDPAGGWRGRRRRSGAPAASASRAMAAAAPSRSSGPTTMSGRSQAAIRAASRLQIGGARQPDRRHHAGVGVPAGSPVPGASGPSGSSDARIRQVELHRARRCC